MPTPSLPTLEVSSRPEWRQWLERHHASAPGIWLVFHKRHTGEHTVTYEDAVEEALCFAGWTASSKDSTTTAMRAK